VIFMYTSDIFIVANNSCIACSFVVVVIVGGGIVVCCRYCYRHRYCY
jgi:hypothetical protein